MRRCGSAACRAGWVDPRPRAEALPALYDSYYTHGDGEETATGWEVSKRAARIRGSLARLMPWRSAQMRSGLCHLEGLAPGRLLEIGCGSGGLLRAALHAGWQPVGVDFDASAVAAAKATPGIEAYTGDITELALPEASFDAVAGNNVIEHVPDPVAMLAECRRLMRPGARLVMTTPNFDALGHDHYGRDWRGLEVPRHLHLFTRESLSAAAHRAGFADVSVFSPIGNGGADYMIEASEQLASKAGRPRGIDWRTVKRRGALGALFGSARGEWIVLVAHR